MEDVFISYSHKKTGVADQIADALERAHISCWVAHRNIKPGQVFADEISKAIDNCKVFLLVLDKHSAHSKFVLSEMNMAFSRINNHEPVTFLTFKADKRTPPGSVRFYINLFQIMDGYPLNPQHIRELIKRIKSILRNPPPQPQNLPKLPNLALREFIRRVIVSLLLALAVMVGVAFRKGAWPWPGTGPDPDDGVTEGDSLQPSKLDFDLQDGVLTISGYGPMPDYQPKGADNVPPWQARKDEIVRVVIVQNSVTTIGDFAFSHCGKLKEVDIPEGVSSIGDWAFAYCDSLPEMYIPNSVKSVGDFAFGDCENLKSVSALKGLPLKDNVTYGTQVTQITRRG